MCLEIIPSIISSAPPPIEVIKLEEVYKVSYWDGYSLAEEEIEKDLNKALKIFKRYSKKMAKNLVRFSN